ncbi:MAG: M15 family metallopeptidase [bacterium]
MHPRVQKFIGSYLPTITAIILPLLLCSVMFLIYKNYQDNKEADIRYATLVERLDTQQQTASSTTATFTRDIETIEQNIAEMQNETRAITSHLSLSLSEAQQKVSSLQNETTKIGSTLGTLEKLSKTDSELLKKYSKVFFLNENYVPAKLSEIKNDYLYSKKQTQYIDTNVLPFLTNMIETAKADSVTLYVKSAYRSFNEQDALKNGYSVVYGAGTASQFSADQGYSEHQLGTTVDLITPGLGGVLSTSFENTKAYTWLQNKAYLYGFILSYPKNNEYYVYEPWHWRFVGRTLAQYLYDNKTNFYDLDQRKIDEYLIFIFD